ncbi:hypothetical protein EON66_10150 [archaeon]|nr:MAG: hypothetical protein EON66_10150 [archaeon]
MCVCVCVCVRARARTYRYEYLWADGVTVTKPVKVTAPEYVDLLMSWIEAQLNNEAIFPTSVGMWLRRARRTNIPCPSPCVYTNAHACARAARVLCRCPLPQDVQGSREEHFQAPLPCVRAHLLQPL